LRRALAAGGALALLSASPAAAEVCDKVEDGFGGWLGLVLVLATVAFVPANAFGRVWPAFLAATIMFLLVEPTVYGLLTQDPVALSAWREGCGRSRLALDVFAAFGLILLGFIGRRQFRAQSDRDEAGGAPSSDGRT